ncbi:uncharacterized protein LOC124937841 [Impatiens glandulifera]|uniref:uncharacterized protein LOC124937841 n=1 Tax=Impatiens glandulifera TaxID=253017 RepID=UPI001FB055BA|nr:uncharacterized protein LOC124937841 [Impatiens glandulifera]
MEEEFLITDVHKLYDQMKKQDKNLTLKRRWLIGLPVSKSEEEKITGAAGKLQESRTIPEAFIREDDVGYETVKSFVNKAFASCHTERENHVDKFSVQPSGLPVDRKAIFSLIDNMTNNGLHLFVKMLTNGKVKFASTRCKMKSIIKEFLPELLGQDGNNSRTVSIPEKLYNLLMDPLNFRETHLVNLSTRCPCAVVNKVLDGLDDMPFRTLSAMHRKVRGIKGYMPQLQPQRSGWGKTKLVDRLRKICTEMISGSDFDDDDKLKEPLAKAMAVAGLWSNLIQGCPFPVKFWKYSSEIEVLQVEIAKAIWLLENKVRFKELKKLQLLLDPNAELSSKSMRMAVKGMLTEFLFECGDMETFPQSLLETIFVINNSSRRCPYRFMSKEEVGKEVESVLCVSSQIKQVLWEFLPEHDFDQDFADAYMEDLEESESTFGSDQDDDDDDDDGTTSHLRPVDDPLVEIEDVGESYPCKSALEDKDKDDIKLIEKRKDVLSPEVVPSTTLCDEKARNRYLIVQESCDKTSMVAYDFIGCILEELANMENLDLSCDDLSYLRRSGSSQNNFQVENQENISSKSDDGCDAIIIRTLGKLLPSFPESGKKKVKEMMGIE